MSHNLVRVLQANLQHGAAIQLSLLNDQSLRNFDLLMIAEPYAFMVNHQWKTHAHLHWRPIFPNGMIDQPNADRNINSMI